MAENSKFISDGAPASGPVVEEIPILSLRGGRRIRISVKGKDEFHREVTTNRTIDGRVCIEGLLTKITFGLD